MVTGLVVMTTFGFFVVVKRGVTGAGFFVGAGGFVVEGGFGCVTGGGGCEVTGGGCTVVDGVSGGGG